MCHVPQVAVIGNIKRAVLAIPVYQEYVIVARTSVAVEVAVRPAGDISVAAVVERYAMGIVHAG